MEKILTSTTINLYNMKIMSWHIFFCEKLPIYSSSIMAVQRTSKIKITSRSVDHLACHAHLMLLISHSKCWYFFYKLGRSLRGLTSDKSYMRTKKDRREYMSQICCFFFKMENTGHAHAHGALKLWFIAHGPLAGAKLETYKQKMTKVFMSAWHSFFSQLSLTGGPGRLVTSSKCLASIINFCHSQFF